MSNKLEKHIEGVMEKVAEAAEVNAALDRENLEVTAKVLAGLLEKLNSTVDELLDKNGSKKNIEYYDKSLAENLKGALKEAVTEFAKIKAPQVTVNPNISVDLSQIKSIASVITEQNAALMGLVKKIGEGDNSQELYRLIVAMVGKNNAFLDKGIKQVNYTEDINKIVGEINVIGQTLSTPKSWEATITKRDWKDRVEKIIFKPINNG